MALLRQHFKNYPYIGMLITHATDMMSREQQHLNNLIFFSKWLQRDVEDGQTLVMKDEEMGRVGEGEEEQKDEMIDMWERLQVT